MSGLSAPNRHDPVLTFAIIDKGKRQRMYVLSNNVMRDLQDLHVFAD